MFSQKLHHLLHDMPKVKKKGKSVIDGKEYNYATLEDIMDAAKPVMHKHNFFMTFWVKDGEVTCALAEGESGKKIESSLPLPVTDDPHRLGSYLTYARRYLAALVLGIVDTQDDDGHAAKGKKPASKMDEPKRSSSYNTAKRMIESATNAGALKELHKKVEGSTKLTSEEKTDLLARIKVEL